VAVPNFVLALSMRFPFWWISGHHRGATRARHRSLERKRFHGEIISYTLLTGNAAVHLMSGFGHVLVVIRFVLAHKERNRQTLAYGFEDRVRRFFYDFPS
jgi:hypothetical protein